MVFICSHSTHFINLDQYRSIVIVRKDNVREGTTVKQCLQELFEGEDAESKKHRFHMASWVNPDRGELFFARKVVLVEGEGEVGSDDTILITASKQANMNSNVSCETFGSFALATRI